MTMTNSKLSSLRLGARRPYEPIQRVLDLPPALFEMATLIEKGLAGDLSALEKAAALQESIIAVALDYPTCLTQIRNLLDNGYDIEFSLIHGEAEKLKTSESVSTLSS